MEKVLRTELKTRSRIISDLEIIEQWGKTNGGTASDIRMQCQELKGRTVREISGMCERLVAEGRLQVTNVPDERYMGRSLKKSLQYMQPAQTSDANVD